MKSILNMIMLGILTMACSHKHKQATKESYSPIVSFNEEGKTFESTIQLPKKFKEKVPLVVVVHEWWGRTPYIQEQAKRLNKKGYATLAVDLFGEGKTVDNPTDAQALATPFYNNPELGIERLNKYIESIKNDPHVDATKIYVIGYCFGGTQALNFARSGADIKGVVSFHGGLATTYPTKEIKTKILILHGGSDPMVPPNDVKSFKEEMKKVNADYQLITYQGATHAFTNPKATEIGKKYNIPIAYNKEAAKASWKELLKFLKK